MIPHETQDLIFHTIVACSVLHTILPPWDFLSDFPTAQKVYKLVIYIVGYVALNGRSTVYKTISVNNPNGVNTNGKTNGGTK